MAKSSRKDCLPHCREAWRSFSNWKCEASWWQEAESVKQQVVLQDPTSMAENSHSNLTFSGWTWVKYTYNKKVHSYIFLGHFEALAHLHDYTLRRGLGRATCHWGLFILPHPTAILQSQGFWQHKGLEKHINTYYDFGGECHPDLQRIGNTEAEKGLASCWR